MAFRILYKTLFQIELLHSYFLDDGAVPFSSMNAEDKKKQLQNYQMSSYLNVVPTFGTHQKLKNHKLIIRNNKDGFRVLVSVTEENDKYISEVLLNGDLQLTFLLYSKDYLFDNYTELTKEENRLYYFSNVKPGTEANPYSYIPLNTSIDLVTEDFLLTEESSQSIWYHLEQENREANPSSQFDVLADVSIDDLATDAGKTIINQAIRKEKGKGLLGIIQLKMLGDNNMDLIEIDITDPSAVKNYLLDPIPDYKLHFDNRKTIWKYIKKADDNELETLSVKPLTRYGFIEIDPDNDFQAPLPSEIDNYLFPNPTADLIKQTTDENTNTTTTYSEIYI